MPLPILKHRLLALMFAVALGGAGCKRPAPPAPPPKAAAPAAVVPVHAAVPLGEPFAEIGAGRAAFDKGKIAFIRRLDVKDGLGPQFNNAACGDCHARPVTGGSGDLAHTAALGLDPEDATKLKTYNRASIDGKTPVIPANAARRIAPPLFGLSLLESIPDETIKAGCGQGHTNTKDDGRMARFGAKPFVVTLEDFVTQAALSEMGITTPSIMKCVAEHAHDKPTANGSIDGDEVTDPEMNAETVSAIAAYLRGLAPPERNGNHPAGEALFKSWGCASCHRPETAPGVAAFTDMCVHHMGAGLDDGVRDREAGTDEFRTTPLWGLRLRQYFLHDGRTTSLAEAIEAHGGEAAPTVTQWKSGSPQQREDLLTFLKTL